MKSPAIRKSVPLAAADWKALDNIASQHGCVYSGRPAWRKLLRRIARWEILCRPAKKEK
jgi:hypothetical protein